MKNLIKQIQQRLKTINKEIKLNNKALKTLLSSETIEQKELETQYTILKINNYYLETKKQMYIEFYTLLKSTT